MKLSNKSGFKNITLISCLQDDKDADTNEVTVTFLNGVFIALLWPRCFCCFLWIFYKTFYIETFDDEKVAIKVLWTFFSDKIFASVFAIKFFLRLFEVNTNLNFEKKSLFAWKKNTSTKVKHFSGLLKSMCTNKVSKLLAI